MESPLISIIVPIYNVEKYLNECIKSLINQTYKNLEIILVDDGSFDSSSVICDEWSKKDNRIKVIHKSNGGLSDARNYGIDASTGEFIMFVDSDDFVDIKIVQDLYTLQSETNADVVCGGLYKYCNNNIREIYNEIINNHKVIFTGVQQLRNLLNSTTDCSACSKLYKKSAIGKNRFIKGRYNEDVIFLFSVYANCTKIIYTNKRYYYYRNTEGSITNILSEKTMHSLQNMLEMEQMTLQNNIPVIEEMKNYKCRICLELGYAIQRDNASKRFPNETFYVKKQIKEKLFYILKHKGYTWKDFIHALIALTRL